MRPTTTASLILAAVAGAALFQVSFQVSALEDELRQANRNIERDRQAMRVLRAEWSYLNQPAQLEDLAKRYLRLQPIETAQLGAVADVELRPEAITDEDGVLLASLPGRPRTKPPAPPRRDGPAPALDTTLPAVIPVAATVTEQAPEATRATRGRDVPRSFDDLLADVLNEDDGGVQPASLQVGRR